MNNNIKYASALGLLATIYAANWALETYGLVPVGFGLMAPAGVYFAGFAFGLRDTLHETGGHRWVLGVIAAGAVLSYVLSDGAEIPGGHASIAVASGAAFLLSELADLGVYTPLRERHWIGAVCASNVVGAVIDSALFLWLAFGSLDNMAGQIVGKSYMIGLALLIMWGVRRAVPRYSLRAESA